MFTGYIINTSENDVFLASWNVWYCYFALSNLSGMNQVHQSMDQDLNIPSDAQLT